jgi:two-component system response regulator TctD
MKLLLAEDDLDFSAVLSRYLADRGWEVLCCADGAEALAVARKGVFDAILLDLGLPTVDGLEVLQRLRSDDTSTPVLVITARGRVTERVVGQGSGAHEKRSKPVEQGQLAERL